jgi:hypothetical protein
VRNVNRAPLVYAFPPNQPTTVDEGATLTYNVTGVDSDGDPPILKINKTITNFSFADDGAGHGTLTITPNYTQAGLYEITFIAKDGADTGGVLLYPNDSGYTTPVNFTVRNVPVAPVLNPIGAKTVIEGGTLTVGITGFHPGGLSIEIFGQNLPLNSTLAGFGGSKVFRFTPSYVQAGIYTVLFYASDGVMADSEYVTITVTEAGNQAPYFQSTFPDTQIVAVGDSIMNHIVAIDPDLGALVLTCFNPPPNTVFVDSGNGRGSTKFKPSAGQVWATYLFRYYVTDPAGAADTMRKWIRVVAFMRGDSNNDGIVNIADISYLISYVFRGGPAPGVLEAADANNDALVNVSDALFLVNYIFRSGPPPEN